MTTDVSSRPRVGSAIDALINYSVDIGAKPASIDPGRTRSRVGNRRPGHEPVRPKRSQLRDRSAIARDDEGSACLHLTKDGRRVIAQFALGDLSVHAMNCSTCSTM